MKCFYFFENWADYAKSVGDKERLKFFDTFIKVCFDDYTPPPTENTEYMYYCLIRPAIEERRNRYALSQSGVDARKAKRREAVANNANAVVRKGKRKAVAVGTAVDTAVATEQEQKAVAVGTAVATAEQPYKEKDKENKEREREIIAHAPADSASVAGTGDGGAADDLLAGPAFDPDAEAESAPATVGGYPVGPNGLPIVTPTLADVREAGRRLGCDPAFAEYFHAEMEKLGWQSRDRGGRMFAVDRHNLMSILRGWWQTEKKNVAARDSQEAARMAANVEGLGLHDTIMDPQNPFKVDE